MPSKRPYSRFIQGTCLVCNKNSQMSNGLHKGRKIYKRTCTKCSMKNNPKKVEKNKVRLKKLTKLKRFPWSEYKEDYCENCGFIPLHSCQLDVDHIDGNKNNNDVNNYRTLCANCHRLKTFLNKDWEVKT